MGSWIRLPFDRGRRSLNDGPLSFASLAAPGATGRGSVNKKIAVTRTGIPAAQSVVRD